MDVLYVSQQCMGCQTILDVVTRKQPKLMQYLTIKWADRDLAAKDELMRMGGRAVPSLVINHGTPLARLYTGVPMLLSAFAERYPA